MRLLVLLILSLILSSLASLVRAVEKPNIVVLYSDDAGYADFGFQPNVRDDMKKLTPHIDSIARDGVRFTNAYMSGCVCSPSRAGLMTGRYQQRFGYDNNLPPGTQNGLSLKETFGAKRLQGLGYRTGLIGKWHLGYPAKFHPNRRGWNWFYGLLQGSRKYYPIKNPSRNRVIQENGKATGETGYVTDRFGDAACRFIAEHSTFHKGAGHSNEPFFLFVSFTAPHGPLQPRASDADRLAHIPDGKRRRYAGLVVALDDNVGKILVALKKAGLEKKTLVLFTNDNGGQTQTGANNDPFRGKKGTLWEGGVRVPWAMRWPGNIKAGLVIDDPVIALDLVPTFVTVAGGEIDPAWNLDGIDLTSRLKSPQEDLPARTLYWRQHGSRGSISLREGNWKLIYNRGQKNAQPQLFDLRRDIGESTDLANDKPDLVKSLMAKVFAWEKELREPLWGRGKRNKKAK